MFQLFSKQLVGTILCIYVHKELLPFIKEFQSDEARVGIMGKMGNKGVIAIRFTLFSTQFCFVSCHLAAGVKKIEKRNNNYQNILEKIAFPTLSNNRKLTIMDHEVIFWFGDFNYRLNNVAKKQAETLVLKGNYSELLENDQLSLEMAKERAFVGFTEEKITFAPTYKYDLFSNTFDTSEKQRVPAWCDRVLYKGLQVKPLFYTSGTNLRVSDHRPVVSRFEVMVCDILLRCHHSKTEFLLITFHRFAL